MVRRRHFGGDAGIQFDGEISRVCAGAILGVVDSSVMLVEPAPVQFILWTTCLREQREIAEARALANDQLGQEGS